MSLDPLIARTQAFAVCLISGFAFAAESPIYKDGETMSDGRKCEAHLWVMLSRNPLVYGCDLDRERVAKRTKELNDAELARQERERSMLKKN